MARATPTSPAADVRVRPERRVLRQTLFLQEVDGEGGTCPGSSSWRKCAVSGMKS